MVWTAIWVATPAVLKDVHLLIPQQALAERPLLPLGGWDEEAEGGHQGVTPRAAQEFDRANDP